MKKKRWISCLLTAALVCSIVGVAPAAHAEEPASSEKTVDWTLEDTTEQINVAGYGDYMAAHGAVTDANRPDDVIELPAAEVETLEDTDAYVTSYMGRDGCLYWENVGGTATWSFEVEQEGYYQLEVDYCAIAGKNYDIVVDILLDGEVPYQGCQNVNLHRLFLDETYLSLEDNDFETNLTGDELRPEMIEQFLWQTQAITDSRREYPGPVYFYLTAGTHEISLVLEEECLAIHALRFCNSEDLPDYEQMLETWDAKDTSGYLGAYEAEKSYLKNDVTLFATYDTAYAHVSPSSASNTYYNTIGKNTWKTIGQEITWEFEVPEDGYYYLAFKVKQNSKSNAYSVRSISIDGEVLCQEMDTQKFPYKSAWYIKTMELEDGTPLKVYLEAGRHVLGMKANSDETFATVLREADQVVTELQSWYREIIKVTGFNADSERITVDLNRDFHLDQVIPNLMDGFQSCKDRLDDLYARVGAIEGISQAGASILKQMSVLLDDLLDHPSKIAKRLETFRSNISTMATWVIDMQDQPLMMDQFYVFSPDMEAPEVGGNAFTNFFRQIAYRFMLFLDSFGTSSNSISGSSEVAQSDTTLRVWISSADITTTGASSGRDQAIILKKLIDESFTSQTGINVDVSLIGNSDTLVQAVLAGEGPDLALFTSVSTPVNLAMRGMVLDLTQFDGFEAVLEQFSDSAVDSFWYQDGLYAFPETINYNMIFYRTDIYEELGLTPPETWEDFYEQIVVLSNHNYMVGVPQNQNIFETFLYQSGTTFYTEDLSQSTFDTSEALEAFENWTNLYNKYSLSLIFDFFNRFRSGEMALAIEPFNQVNYLYSAAPELDGMWSIAPVPGTRDKETGEVNRVETATSTGGIILSGTEYPEEAYEFLKWWVSSDTQADFGTQVEQSLGVAARYATANLEAFDAIPWTRDQADALREQWENTVAIEQIPGNYYIARNLSFAFRAVVYNHANLRETLNKYNIEINKELARKQEEFSYR